MLTQKQENFTLDLFQGVSETKAYQNHYSTENMSIGAIYVEACRLKANPKVSLRLEELNKPIVKKIQASKETKLEKLEDIFSHQPLPETITARERIFAIAEHNKMDGAYPVEKHAISQDVTIRFIVGKGYEKIEEEE